jgi:hypothetical protein
MRTFLSKLLNRRVLLPGLMLLIAVIACQCDAPTTTIMSYCQNNLNTSNNSVYVNVCYQLITESCDPFMYYYAAGTYYDCMEYEVASINRRYPPTTPTQPSVPAVATVDCTPFRLTHPLSGMPDGTTTFYWDSLPDAQRYTITIYDHEGNPRTTLEADGSATNVDANVSMDAIGGLFNFRVVAQAFIDDEPVCTDEHHIPREAPASVPPADNRPVCGNNICEPGEFNPDETGTCPADCVET